MKQEETGRSMVEMLGILAIMGVISTVGIKIYTNTMTRHRANELIYEAHKRATMIASQLLNGRDPLSVTGFTDPAGYTFGAEKNPANANQFNITINAVDSKICQQMKTAVGPTTPIRLISEYCDKLTFNNDLSTTVYASDIQDPDECTSKNHTWCSGSKVCQEKSDCCSGKELGTCQTCLDGAVMTTLAEGKACDYNKDGVVGDGLCHFAKCQALPSTMTCDSTTGLCTCNNGGTLCNRSNGTCCLASEMCTTSGDINGGKCVTLSSSESECTTNADCPANKPLCSITSANNNCSNPTTGICIELDTPETLTIAGLGEVFFSNETMNWWTAKNWCNAQGKRLINVEDFQAYKSDSTQIITGNTNNSALCAKGKVCGSWSEAPYKAMWDWKTRTLTDAKDENSELYSSKFSPIVVEFERNFIVRDKWSTLFWTASGSSGHSSCAELTVAFGSGMVKYSWRTNTNYALCK